MSKVELKKMKKNAKKMADLAEEYRTINSEIGETPRSEENNEGQEQNLNNDLETVINMFEKTNNKIKKYRKKGNNEGTKTSKESNPEASNGRQQALIDIKKVAKANVRIANEVIDGNKKMIQKLRHERAKSAQRTKLYKQKLDKVIDSYNKLINNQKKKIKDSLDFNKKMKKMFLFRVCFFLDGVSAEKCC